MTVLVPKDNLGGHIQRSPDLGHGQLVQLKFASKTEVCNLDPHRLVLLLKIKSGHVLHEIETLIDTNIAPQLTKVEQNIVKFKIAVHHVLRFNRRHSFDDPTENYASVLLRQTAASCLHETLKVASIAQFKSQVKIARCSGRIS